MKVFILAAGLGTRLKPLTDRMPKALVEIDGMTMLERVIKRFKSAGYNDFVVNVHHFADMIVEYLSINDNFGCNISISDERDRLRDTGGAVKHAAKYFDGEAVIIHNVDIESNLDLASLRSIELKGDAAVIVSKRDTQRYLMFDSGRLVGWKNFATAETKSPYTDFNPDNCVPLAFSGIHILSPRAIDAMKSWPDKFSIIDFYLYICRDSVVTPIIAENLKLTDLGKMTVLNSIINLPEPNKGGGMPLSEAISKRRSVRVYDSEREIDMQTLSTLLWSAFGYISPKRRSAPSSHNRQEMELYLAMKSGLYIYQAQDNSLLKISDADFRAASGEQDFCREAPLNIILVADSSKITGKSPQGVIETIYVDAGFICQNIYLAATALGLVSVVRALIPKEELAAKLKLSSSQIITMAHTVGYAKNN